MKIPLQVSFHGIEPSTALEARIREKARKLERFHSRLTSCRVIVEAPARRRHAGRLYRVRIELNAPGYELVVGNTGRSNPAHEDVYVAVRDAFNAATRQLEDHVRISRGDVKSHDRVKARSGAAAASRAENMISSAGGPQDVGSRSKAKGRKKPKGLAPIGAGGAGTKATLSDIREIAGEIDDADAAAILATDATCVEFEKAYHYVSGGGDIVGRSGRPLTGAVADIYEILTADDEDGRER